MPLSPGDKLGQFDVLSLLGKGGMGEVYRGRDTQLKREVALKVLPAAFSSDPDRLARFQREAELLASLDHPNIGHIYGMVQSERNWALVLALIEGPTLDDRIKQGPLPPDEAIAISKQIIDALEYAHEHGVIHRDLKPANIKVTPEGVVKVLDFGLAKALDQRAATSLDPENSPTLTMGATQAGVIMGTAAYMSPEQAVGKAADRRSDIFSFGVVLYEMLTGKRPFRGDSMGDTLAAVVKDAPDWTALPAETPSYLRKLLERMLAKDRKERLQAIGEARIALARPQTDDVPKQAEAPAPHTRPWGITAAAAAFALALAALAFIHFQETPTADLAMHLSVPLPETRTPGFVALSPDGRRLVVGLTTEGTGQLWLRSLDSPQLKVLPGTEGARGPFWSPDGKSIGFVAEGKLKIMPAAGGPTQVLCGGMGQNGHGTWNRDGVILFSTSGVGESLQRVSAAGGACTAVTKPEEGTSHYYPEFLPDGQHFVYVVLGVDDAKRGLYVSSLSSGLNAGLEKSAPRRLVADGSSAVFAPSATGKNHGYLLFLRENALMAQPFNAETLQLVGDVFPVGVEASNEPGGRVAASASASGTLIYGSSLEGGKNQLTWLDRSGKELDKVGSIQRQMHVGLSPDGKSAATVRSGQIISDQSSLNIWLLDMQRGAETRFTLPPLPGTAPVWSPDGNLIAFGSGKGLYLKEASGGAKEELVSEVENGNDKVPSDWSRDGRYLIYTEIDPKDRGDIWYVENPRNKSGGGKPVKFQGTTAIESQGQLSPDGHWLAYTSDESGQSGVYVRPFPSGPGRWKVSGDRVSREPRWRRDGKELFFLEDSTGNRRLITAAVQSGPRGDFQAGAPQKLFELRANASGSERNRFIYSPSADGQRFLFGVSHTELPTVNVISNWEKAALTGK